jgi:hypothetical protein
MFIVLINSLLIAAHVVPNGTPGQMVDAYR